MQPELLKSKKAKVVLAIATGILGFMGTGLLDPVEGARCLTVLGGIYALAQAYVDKVK